MIQEPSPHFEDAPPVWFQRKLGLITGARRRIGSRALIGVMVAWVPLFVFTIVQSVFLDRAELGSLATDFGVHARYLVAVPLFILAEHHCAPMLNQIVAEFVNTGLVTEAERARFDEEVARGRRRLGSPVAEAAVVVLSYGFVALAVSSITGGMVTPWQVESLAPALAIDQMPAWHLTGGFLAVFSPAGWWHVLVSLPLLLMLFLGWIWRLLMWTWLLWRISRLKLQLVPAHPDRMAGLGFVSQSIRAFSVLAFAIGTIAASRVLRVFGAQGALTENYLEFTAGMLLFILVLFAAPLLVFVPNLLRARWSGVLDYGKTAVHLGETFEQEWLHARVDKSSLQRPDFSATTDLYSVVSNVYSIRLVPIDLRDLAIMAVSLAAPFIPVIFLAFPADTIWRGVKNMLF
jgi:hypothetical protein